MSVHARSCYLLRCEGALGSYPNYIQTNWVLGCSHCNAVGLRSEICPVPKRGPTIKPDNKVCHNHHRRKQCTDWCKTQNVSALSAAAAHYSNWRCIMLLLCSSDLFRSDVFWIKI